ncbi:hypothetical protein ACH8E3_15185 [Paenibacillus sp. CMAA1364]
MKQYMKDHEFIPYKRKLYFTKFNELSLIIYDVCSQESVFSFEELEDIVVKAINVRIDLLLDLFSYVESIRDKLWLQHIRQRLSHLSSVLVELNCGPIYS